MRKYKCPYCREEQVEEVMACGSTTYFCNACKQMVSKKKLEEANNKNK